EAEDRDMSKRRPDSRLARAIRRWIRCGAAHASTYRPLRPKTQTIVQWPKGPRPACRLFAYTERNGLANCEPVRHFSYLPEMYTARPLSRHLRPGRRCRAS